MSELIENDKHLVPLLRACNNDELKFLVDLIKDQISEDLTSHPLYIKHYPSHYKYSDIISREIQLFAGNSVFNIFSGEGVPYKDIVRKVADKMDIDYSDRTTVHKLEMKIIEKALEKSFDEADEKTRKDMIDALGDYKGNISDYAKYSKQAFMSSIQIIIKLGGFGSYQLAMVVANGIAKTILGKGLALATNAALARGISIFVGPIGWAVTIIWTILDIAGPAYRVIIPAVIYISYLRLKFLNQRRGFILLGKSGHGKSSLINCLAGSNIAKIGHIKPESPNTKPYELANFNGKYPLRIIDTRGIFESTKPDKSVSDEALSVLRNSMIRENPAVVMHIISAKEIRAMSEDQKVFKEIMKDIKASMNNNPHRIFVITKSGDIIDPRNFPTPKHFTEITKLINYFCDDVLGVKTSPFDSKRPELGCKVIGKSALYQAVIPVKCLSIDESWNIDTLSTYLESLIVDLKLHEKTNYS